MSLIYMRTELIKKELIVIRFRNYNFEDFNNRWISLVESIVENHGSWDSRKGYKTWEIKEIA